MEKQENKFHKGFFILVYCSVYISSGTFDRSRKHTYISLYIWCYHGSKNNTILLGVSIQLGESNRKWLPTVTIISLKKFARVLQSQRSCRMETPPHLHRCTNSVRIGTQFFASYPPTFPPCLPPVRGGRDSKTNTYIRGIQYLFQLTRPLYRLEYGQWYLENLVTI